MANIDLAFHPEVPEDLYGVIARSVEVAGSEVVYGDPTPRPGDIDVITKRAGPGSRLGAMVLAKVGLAGNCWPQEGWVESATYPGLLVRPKEDEGRPLLLPGNLALRRHEVAVSSGIVQAVNGSGALEGVSPAEVDGALLDKLSVWTTPFTATGFVQLTAEGIFLVPSLDE